MSVCSLLGHLGWSFGPPPPPGTREQTLRLGFDLAIRAGASSVQAWRLTQDHPRTLLRAGMGVPVLAGPWARSIRTLAA